MRAGELVFMPGRGFMPAYAPGTRSNVVIDRGGRSFAGAVVPDRDGIQVIFSVHGIDAEVPDPKNACALPIKASARVVDDRGREVAPRPRWITGPYLRDAGGGKATMHWTLMLLRPEPDARTLSLSFDGPAGDWEVPFPLERIENEGIPAFAIDAAENKHGVTVAARAIARTADMTAVELEAYLDPPSMVEGWARRYVEGIGPTMHSGRLVAGQILLRDDAGNAHLEKGQPIDEQTGGKRREAVMFPALPTGVRSGTIEVDEVWVHEGTDEIVSVPVPGEADLTLAGCSGRVAVTRVQVREGAFRHLPGGPARSAVHVETKPADPAADHQLVYLPPADRKVGMTVTHCFGQLPTVDVPETTEQLSAVTFRGGTVQVRGRWRLAIPLAP